MSNLKSTLESLSAEFASSVLRAIRAASLEDLVGESSPAASPARPGPKPGRPAGRPVGRPAGRPAKAAAAPAAAPAPAAAAPAAAPKGGRKGASRRRLARRSPNDINNVVEQIVSLLSKKTEGLRSEDIRRELGLAANEMPRPLAEGLKTKKLSKEGEKRATVYFAKSASGKKK